MSASVTPSCDSRTGIPRADHQLLNAVGQRLHIGVAEELRELRAFLSAAISVLTRMKAGSVMGAGGAVVGVKFGRQREADRMYAGGARLAERHACRQRGDDHRRARLRVFRLVISGANIF